MRQPLQMILPALLVMLLAAAPARAQSMSARQAAQAMTEAWEAWMAEHRIPEGAIAIAKGGKIIAEAGLGRDADTPAPVASLSKAITALCTLSALSDAGHDTNLRLQDALGAFFSRYRARDRRLFRTTIGHLMTHDSGIRTQIEQRYARMRAFSEPQLETQMRIIALGRLGSNPGRSNYHYANANYLALGLAIEALSGRPYPAYCTEKLLAPLGITTARISPDWAITGPYGGWIISARDYLTLMNAHFAGGLILGRTPHSYTPKTHIGNNVYYGPGILFRKTDAGTLIWHAGAWRWEDETRSARFGAYALMLENGLSLVTNYAHAGENGALEALEQRLVPLGRAAR